MDRARSQDGHGDLVRRIEFRTVDAQNRAGGISGVVVLVHELERPQVGNAAVNRLALEQQPTRHDQFGLPHDFVDVGRDLTTGRDVQKVYPAVLIFVQDVHVPKVVVLDAVLHLFRVPQHGDHR